MTLETSPSDPRHDTDPIHHIVWVPVVFTVLDRAITLPYYHLEGNPIVIELGVINWVFLTIGLIVGYVFLWYRYRLWNSSIVVSCIAGLSVLTASAVVTNILVVLGILQ